MSSTAEELAKALKTIDRPASFSVGGTQQTLAPGLSVQGVGPVALPLIPAQAQQLIAVAQQAPYGRGSETIVDTSVRRTWQISPTELQLTGKQWPKTLEAIVTRVANGLGISNPIDASLYKLLIYNQGSFFVPHRDTEKQAGMFATLVIALPSVSQGGALIVRHKDQEQRYDLQTDDAAEAAFAAFYADCVHEVVPVTQGHRLVLVYNLLRRGRGPLPKTPEFDVQQTRLTSLLTKWHHALHQPHTDEPLKLIFPLEHAYTPAELSFTALKGGDAGLGSVMTAAAPQAGCDVHLALVSIEESGSAENNGHWGRHNDRDFEIVEMFERIAVASSWRRPDGTPALFSGLPVKEEEFVPPIRFDKLKPDEQHFHEATGNEGASYERTYSRAAIIVWPTDRVLSVVNQAGLDVTLPYLEDLTQQGQRGADRTRRAQALELAKLTCSTWNMDRWDPKRNGERSPVGQFLTTLVTLNEPTLADTFLTALSARPGFDIGDCKAIANAVGILPDDRQAALARSLIATSASQALAAAARLLTLLEPSIAQDAAKAAAAAVPAGPQNKSAFDDWRRGPGVSPSFVADLMTGLCGIDAALANASVDRLLKNPAIYDFDDVLRPAIHRLLEDRNLAKKPAVLRLKQACLDHLNARTALPLEPPADWQRDSKLECKCVDCQALSRFLADATQPKWVFAAAQARRTHVEQSIRRSKADVKTATEKKGSPHQLVCTKTQASYERRRKQRKTDLTERQRLIG
jgi:predicted 2-oxoglutarate/Fe(II)-dependent dioxygenase YbiX